MTMRAIEGISYFRKPYEYGSRDWKGEYGILEVHPQKLVVRAKT
jgi:hypothetical protein